MTKPPKVLWRSVEATLTLPFGRGHQGDASPVGFKIRRGLSWPRLGRPSMVTRAAARFGRFRDGALWNAKRGSAQSCADLHRGLSCQKGRLRSDASAWALIYINTRALRPASVALSEWLPGLTAFTEGGRGPSESSGRGGESAPARLYLGGGTRRDLRAGANAASSSDVPAGSDSRVEDRATAQQSAVRFAVRPGTQAEPTQSVR